MSVFISNVDDFILPSQACVNPFVLAQTPDQSAASSTSTSTNKIVIQNDFSTSSFGVSTIKPNLIKSKVVEDKKVATVSLTDCLACSGCVTSAESVLIQEQGYTKLTEALKEGCKIVVVALSPQSVASFAAHLDISYAQTFLVLAAALKSVGVSYVVDMDATNDISLIETRNEFIERYELGRSNIWSTPATISSALSSTRSRVVQDGDASATIDMDVGDASAETLRRGLPMFISSCPGWICYAEKTQPQVLDYVSRTKSGQQILGALLKYMFVDEVVGTAITSSSGRNSNSTQKDIYIVSIQPCFDKKLEGSRRDFFHDEIDSQEIDLVLSTTELWNLFDDLYAQINSNSDGGSSECGSSKCASLSDYLLSFPLDSPFGNSPIERLFRNFSEDGRNVIRSTVDMNESGGFMDYIVRSSAQYLFAADLGPEKLKYIAGRNTDVADYRFQDRDDPNKTMSVGKSYGFRNIQSSLLKLKRGKLDLDLIEVMACPSGCVNGGGQIKGAISETPAVTKTRVDSVISKYQNSDFVFRAPDESPLARHLYGANTFVTSVQLARLLRTRYHVVPKLEIVAPLAAKW